MTITATGAGSDNVQYAAVGLAGGTTLGLAHGALRDMSPGVGLVRRSLRCAGRSAVAISMPLAVGALTAQDNRISDLESLTIAGSAGAGAALLLRGHGAYLPLSVAMFGFVSASFMGQ